MQKARYMLIAVWFGTAGLAPALAKSKPPVLAAPAAPGGNMNISPADLQSTLQQLLAKVGEAERARCTVGLSQVAQFWRPQDGTPDEFRHFCLKYYATGEERQALFERFMAKIEQIAGHMNSLSLKLRLELDEDRGPLLPVDGLFAGLNLGAHLEEDFFQSKLAFLVLLNFPKASLDEMLSSGEGWSRRQWAETRLAQQFNSRVPAEVLQRLSLAYAGAEDYVAGLILWMDHILGSENKPVFPAGTRLISHWGLRDEIRAQYADPQAGPPRQRLIQRVLERIVEQEIPAVVLNNATVFWDPVSNKVNGVLSPREPDTRYARMLDIFQAHRGEDPFYPSLPTRIARGFQRDREIPEVEVVGMLERLLLSPVGAEVARLIGQRLGRVLQPFDIWYDGFRLRSQIPEAELDRLVQARFPNGEAFQKAIGPILRQLGFAPATSEFLAQKIQIDAARGSGHAWGPLMRSEKAHLRTRFADNGMNYKGFNIAMHELGHNVEQIFSLHKVDYYFLQGVPNSGFSEAFAFVFQRRDLEILGREQIRPGAEAEAEALDVLDSFWAARELAAVALLDIRAWHWMDDHPRATPAELKAAVLSLAKGLWNQYFAPAFELKDSPLLAVYSHMVNSGLYLPDYPIGQLIAFQIGQYLKTRSLGSEMEKMCALGRLTPSAWMKAAVGAPLSPDPMLKAVEQALRKLSQPSAALAFPRGRVEDPR